MPERGEKAGGLPVKKSLVLSLVLTASLWAYSSLLGLAGLKEGCFGYLFLWFWSGVRGFAMGSFAADALNSCVGIACGLLAQWILRSFGIAAFAPAVFALSFIVIFLSMAKLAPLIVGDATFLFMALLTGHLYLTQASYVDVALSYAGGVVFFTAAMLLVGKLLEGGGAADKGEAGQA